MGKEYSQLSGEERLRATLPVESDCTSRLIARAWAVRGVK